MTQADLLTACQRELARKGAHAKILLRVSGDPGNRAHVRLVDKGTPKGLVLTGDGEGNTIAEFSATDVADYLLGRGRYHEYTRETA